MALAGYTHVTLVLDRSSSMHGVREDAIGGFNQFLEQQRALPGRVTLGFIQFDQHVDLRYQALPLAEVPDLTLETYVLGWGTALLDAVGMAVLRTRRFVQQLDEAARPERVVIAILTDGYENASRVHDMAEVAGLVAALEATAGWRFLFLGANIDVWRVGRALGVPQETTVPFVPTRKGTADAFTEISEFVTVTRRGRRRSTDGSGDGGSGQVH